MKRLSLSLIGFAALLTISAPAFAQTSPYNERILTQLYQAQLKKENQSDHYIEKRIADEREAIRIQADAEVKTLTTTEDADAQTDVATGLPKAIDRQRAIIDILEEKLRNLNVDIDILLEEEKKYYLGKAVGTGSIQNLRLTTSHEELLAKKAILEEWIAAFSAGLVQQNSRLSKLNTEQVYDQLVSFFAALQYVFIILGAFILDRIVAGRLVRRIAEKSRRYHVAKLMSALIYGVAILIVMSKLLADYPGTLASFAIVGAGLAVALQDVVKDVVAWIIIINRRLYSLGDRIVIGTHKGDIIDIGVLRTTMLEVSEHSIYNAHERTGKILSIPNSLILREAVLNYNAACDYMSVEQDITITFPSNWQKTDALLQGILKQETAAFSAEARKQQRRRTALYYTSWEASDPEVHMDIASSGILFTLKFMVPIGQRRTIISKLSRAIMAAIELESDVDLAYNTMKIEGVDLKG